MVCDLQGVRRDDRYILTDPVICSTGQLYGATYTHSQHIRTHCVSLTRSVLCMYCVAQACPGDATGLPGIYSGG